MANSPLRVLFLSEFFPNPAYPALGIFIERQASHLQDYCQVTAIAPVRVFPPGRLWKQLLSPQRFRAEWGQWRHDLAQIPVQGQVNGIPVFYPRYTSPPRPVFHGLWGFFAYPFLRRQLMDLHRQYHFDLIHAHYASPWGLVALLAKRWMGAPIVLSIHGADVTYTARQHPLSAAIVRRVFRQVDVILANSTWTVNQIVYYGGEPEKIKIVRYGGNAPPELAPPDTGSPNNVTTILSVGYLIERKAHAYVLQAIKKLRDKGYQLHYVIVGDGPQREALTAMTETLGIADIVSFAGYKPHAEVWPYFATCDIFVLPSWDEAFGIVYTEALSLGKPVIGCAGEGGPEDLKSLGDCIQLVQSRDVDSLAQGLQSLLDNPQRRQQMGETGRQIVQEHFTWSRNAAATWQIYQQVLPDNQKF